MKCPVATKDTTINMQNRGKAIAKANYGPMDPDDKGDSFWREMASQWEVSPAKARKMICGTCSAFNQSKDMLKCIEAGASDGMKGDKMEAVKAGDVGFCEIFDFKCSSKRTCAAWIAKGSDEEKSDESEEYEESEEEYEDDERSDIEIRIGRLG